ncbi:UPF0061 [Acrasis kona]|uniref:Selenoprotein O n=1 Tax=Acrasis kona TaxID=1008807 RepID=A0AAW2ZPN9_9EUKA
MIRAIQHVIWQILILATCIASALHIDNINHNNVYANLTDSFYSIAIPTPVSNPYLISFNTRVANLIGIDFTLNDTDKMIQYFSGNKLIPGSKPIAMSYSGHQFGYYTPQLGDGRAILLTQIKSPNNQTWDLHLKGGGRTAYSRGGDGRAVLRSTIREYLGSEGVAALGIPTTRSLCITGTDDPVYRENVETGAMLIRVAPSHIRFGSFELQYYSKNQYNVKVLADHVIEEHFSIFKNCKNKYSLFFEQVVRRTAVMIADWMSVGYENGVMNTDNMSILGLTIDYGPFGFVEEYDPDWVVNHSDDEGRYSLRNQPSIGLWNLERLSLALSPLDHGSGLFLKNMTNLLADFMNIYNEHYYMNMNKKLGLTIISDYAQEDRDLVDNLLDAIIGVDYTNFFRELSSTDVFVKNIFVKRKEKFSTWVESYKKRLLKEPNSDFEERSQRMKKTNPKYIPRTHAMQTAIEAAQSKNFSIVNDLLNLYQNPYDEHPEYEEYSLPAPKGFKNTLTCSS